MLHVLPQVSAGGPYALFLPLLPGNKFRASLRRSPAEAAPEPGKSSLWLRIESGDTAVNASSWWVLPAWALSGCMSCVSGSGRETVWSGQGVSYTNSTVSLQVESGN